jgi:hypothetical protein
MSISLDSAGALVIKSSGTGANSNALTISAPSSVAANTAISMYDPGFACNLAFGSRKIEAAVAVSTLLTASQSGSIIPLSLNTATSALTFPAPLAGMSYLLVVSTTGAKVCTITGTFSGTIINVATALACAAKANIVTSATSLAGDWIEVYCVSNGTWLVRGLGGAAASFA